jgi:hypothetical protein
VELLPARLMERYDLNRHTHTQTQTMDKRELENIQYLHLQLELIFQVKLSQPDMSCSLIHSIDSKDFGEVTSISYANGILASGHSQETIQLWRPHSKQTFL